ncbi:MAG: permease prefix domain 1-containing protein [Ilumatobacteraceae bacterium]
MAIDRVITEYLHEVDVLLATYRHRERVVNEIADHLRERVESLVAAGNSEVEAAEVAVCAFGDPTTYVESFKVISAMPNSFTRWSGLAGLFGPFVLFAIAATQPQNGNKVPWPLLAPFFLTLTGLVGVVVRTRGSFGRLRGWSASALVVVGASVGATGGYGIVGVVCVVAVIAGLVLTLHTTFRVGALPRPATLTIAVAGVTLVAMIGSDMKEASAPVYAAGTTLLIGWCWLQYTLWSESAKRRPAA